MPDLTFTVDGAEPVAHTMTPTIGFLLGISEKSGVAIDAIALNCQIMIEATRRPYADTEREALLDIFGVPERWGKTLKTMLWTHASMVVPSFNGQTTAELRVPASFDLSLAATKYFYALEDGHVPLELQFSGTVFHRDADGDLQTAPIPWSKEAGYRLPVSIWQQLMRELNPDSIMLPLQRDVFDRLYRLRQRRGYGNWERLIDELMAGAEETVAP